MFQNIIRRLRAARLYPGVLLIVAQCLVFSTNAFSQIKLALDQICDAKQAHVTKSRLAQSLVDQTGVSAALTTGDLAPPANPADGPERWRRIYADPYLCTDAKGNPALDKNGNRVCSVKDTAAVDSGLDYLESIYLAGKVPGLKPKSKETNAHHYFEGDDMTPEVSCDLGASPSPHKAPDITPPTIAVRLRGNADQLTYTHDDDLFPSTDGASIGFKSGSTGRTDSVVGAVGYQFDISGWLHVNEAYLVPYFGLDREVTNKTGATAPTFNRETVQGGVIGEALWYPSGVDQIGHQFVVRPDYLFNLQDDSRLASLNLRYQPNFHLFLNSYTPLWWGELVRFAILADLRNDYGKYTDRGIPSAVPTNKDYVRLGGRGGAGMTLNFVPQYPIDLLATYTGLAGLTGYRSQVGLFNAGITFNFGENRLVGLTVSYKNGLDEFTALRVNAWNVGLSAHY